MNTNNLYHNWGMKILVIFIAGILDFGTNYLFNFVLHVPLFLDTIFLMAVLYIYGPLESFLVYVVNIICVCIRLLILYGKVEYVYLYSISAIVIILISWLFIRKKEKFENSVNFVFLYILGFSILAALACSVVSGIISYFTFEYNIDEWAFDKIIFSLKVGDFGKLGTCIVGRIPITVLDRIIASFAGFGIWKIWKKVINEK